MEAGPTGQPELNRNLSQKTSFLLALKKTLAARPPLLVRAINILGLPGTASLDLDPH